jgi:hypothetical protein
MWKKMRFIFCIVLLACNWYSVSQAQEEKVEFSPTYLKVIDKLESLTPGHAIEIKMGVQKERYKVGETFEMRFQVSQDCYCTLMYLNSTGAIWFLIPNGWASDPKIKGKRVYSTQQDFKLNLSVISPLTVDVFNFFCSSKPLDLFDADWQKEHVYQIAQQDEIQFTQLLNRLDQLHALEWSGNSIVIRTGTARGVGSRKIGAIPSTESGDFFPPLDSEKTDDKP